MLFHALRVLIPAALLPLAMSHAGGWAIVTVDDVPDYAVAGTAVTLSWVVRQHGKEPVDQLSARIEAVSGSTKTTVAARGTGAGRYTASLTLPRPGHWKVTIRSGFGRSDLALLPLPVVSPGMVPAVALTDIDRGERLFVAKGCVTCHVDAQIGPTLAGRRFEPAYLTAFLEKPRRISPTAPMVMPDLGLKRREIASLVAYLNSDRQLTAR